MTDIHGQFLPRLVGIVLLPALVAAILLFPLSVGAIADSPELLTIGLNSTVRRMEIDPYSLTFTAPNGGPVAFTDMARMPDGRFLAYASNINGNTPGLWQVNPANGSISLLVQSADAPQSLTALTALPDGDLLAHGHIETVGSSFIYDFVRLDPDTLEFEYLPNSAPSLGFYNLATSPAGEVYVWSGGFENVSGEFLGHFTLGTIDPDTGVITDIGGPEGLVTNSLTAFADMDFTRDGRLFGFTDINSSPWTPQSVYEIDLETGIPTFVSQPGSLFASLRGVAFLVPEPSAALLFAECLGLMCACRFRFRRQY